MSAVQANPCSWLKWTRKPNNGYAKQGQFDRLAVNIPVECIAKADQWMLLNRQHSVDVLDLVNKVQQEKQLFHDGLYSLFNRVHASDEMFFPTCLSMIGHLPTTREADQKHDPGGSVRDSKVETVIERRVTFCNWTEDSARNPMTFKTLLPCNDLPQFGSLPEPQLHPLASEEGCLFMRKLKVDETNSSRIEVRKRVLLEWMTLVSEKADVSDLTSLLENVNKPGRTEGGEENLNEDQVRAAVALQCTSWVETWQEEKNSSQQCDDSRGSCQSQLIQQRGHHYDHGKGHRERNCDRNRGQHDRGDRNRSRSRSRDRDMNRLRGRDRDRSRDSNMGRSRSRDRYQERR